MPVVVCSRGRTTIRVRTLKVRCVLIFLVAIAKEKESWSESEEDPAEKVGVREESMVGSPGAVWKE